MSASASVLIFACFLLVHTGFHVDGLTKKISIFDYFKKEIPDLENNLGLLKWSKVITSNEELRNEIISGGSNMIKTNVVVNNNSSASIEPTDPTIESQLSLEEFLIEFKRNGEKYLKGLMMHLKTQDGFDSALMVLDKMDLNFPLWLHMNVGKGPGGGNQYIDPKYSLNSKILDLCTTSVGLTTGLDLSSEYTKVMMKSMAASMNEKNDFYAIRGVYLKKSWSSVTSVDTKPLVVFDEEEDVNHVNVLSMRNILKKYTRNFKDFPGDLEQGIAAVCKDKPNMYEFLKGKNIEFKELKFHADVESLSELEEALKSEEFHVIKAKVSSKHDKATIGSGDDNLKEFFDRMRGKDKIAKLHFLTTEAFEFTIRDYQELIKGVDYPIWIEANVIEGPSGVQTPVDLKIAENLEILSCHALSLGLTSTNQNEDRMYEREMIYALKAFEELDGPIIINSLRAIYVYKSLDPIDANLYTSHLYFWAEADDDAMVISYDLRRMRSFFKSTCFWDLPQEMEYRLKECPANRNEVKYFGLWDGWVKLKFADYVDSEDDFNEKMNSNLDMIKARVYLKKDQKRKDEAVIGETTSFSLSKLFEEFEGTTKKKGLVLRFEETSVFKFTLETFKNQLRTIPKPIWLYLDVASGPGGTNSNLIKTDYLLNNDVMDCCTMLYGWSTSTNNSEKFYTKEHAREMESYSKGDGPTLYAIRAEYATDATFENWKPAQYNLYTYLPKEDRDAFVSREFRQKLVFLKGNTYADVEEHFLLECAKSQEVGDFFQIGKVNLTKLTFSKNPIGNVEDLNTYLDDDKVHMIKANIQVDQNRIPIVAEGITLEALFLAVEKSDKKKGLELTLPSDEAVQAVIATSLDKLKKLEFPIWLRAFITEGPGSKPSQKTVDLDYYHFNDILDCRNTILAWTIDPKQTEPGFTQNHIDEFLANDAWKIFPKSRILIEIRGEFVSNSWKLFWNNFYMANMKMWIPDDDERGLIIAKDLRNVALNYFGSVYVDIPEDLRRVLVACPEQQDIYLYFWKLDDLRQNATRLEFHESVRTLDELEEAMLSDKHMINIEVYEKNDEAVVDKVPGEGDAIEVTLGEFLNAFEGKEHLNMGIQLLFKSTAAFETAIKKYYDQIRNMDRPIWINANILKGPGGGDDIVNLDYIKHNDLIDCRTTVLGWTTGSASGTYTKEQIEEMKRISSGVSRKLYSIRMMNLIDSWDNLKALKDEKLVLWAADEDVGKLEVGKLRSLIEEGKERMFFGFDEKVRRALNNGAGKDANVPFVLMTVFAVVKYSCYIL